MIYPIRIGSKIQLLVIYSSFSLRSISTKIFPPKDHGKSLNCLPFVQDNLNRSLYLCGVSLTFLSIQARRLISTIPNYRANGLGRMSWDINKCRLHVVLRHLSDVVYNPRFHDIHVARHMSYRNLTSAGLIAFQLYYPGCSRYRTLPGCFVGRLPLTRSL